MCNHSQLDSVPDFGLLPSDEQTGMYGPPPCRKRKMNVTGWSAQMYSAFVGHKLLAWMECAARSSYLVRQPWKAFRLTGCESAGFDRCVISYSPADLAENRRLRSSRWSVDVGIANAISKPGLSQASSAGQSRCRRSGQRRGPIGFILGEHGPGHTRQLIR